MYGVLLCLLSAGLLGIQIPLAKLSYDAGADAFLFACARSVLISGLFIALALMQGVSLALPRRALPMLAIITAGTTAISYGYLGAIDRIPASLAAMVFYLYPLFVLLVGAMRERRLPGPRRTAILVLAFVGLGFVFGPSFQDLDGIGVAMGVLAALGATAYFTFVPSTAAVITSYSMLAWSNLIVAVLFIPPVLSGDLGLPTGQTGWMAFLVGAAVYAAGLGLTFPAIGRAGSVKAAMLYNFEPVVIIVVSALLLGEWLTPIQYGGVAAVLVALVFASARSAEDQPGLS
ncbi:MAG: DMT family transporter [Alphaproteobacteria bacterium]|nr:DMT family transporter [Alphaproteobacteria bacterium]